MHYGWDLTVNLPSLLTAITLGVTLIWKASQFVEETRTWRRDFNEHVEENRADFKEIREALKKPP